MSSALLQNKHAVLTGAGGGIGLATAEAFVREGAKCTIVDIHPQASEGVVALIEKAPSSVQYVSTDITNLQQIDEMVATAIARFGAIDVLFNNAGIAIFEKLLDSTEAAYDKLFNVNVKGLFFVMQKVLQHMVDSGVKGSVINLSSQAGRRGEALVAHYCATKAAVISYTQSAALAMAPHGIRVNAIAPGVIDTPMWKQVDAMFAQLEGLEIGQKKEMVGKAVPLGRFGFPEEVADAAVFLASELSRYITAQTLNVDGGNVMS
ncbi:L-iditol 2-dehydrogenase [Leeia sp. TBRC 13508]|uniref:L-iditol 2-dehydrogenase n=1 Tax=Leeia speluncae TaxID=2884804 RepID=A0ABS8D5P0_9NEIS|nr:L-iditol 2-dehydrogenase [Leeia speluncae]MCB6183518.1 L-iditol 2-dehydrogenase [Leeia speluncae]